MGLICTLSKKRAESQVNDLIYSLEDIEGDLLLSYDLSEADRKKYQPVKDKSDSHFVIKKNFISERAKFNMRENLLTVSSLIFMLLLNFVILEIYEMNRPMVGILDKQLSENLQLDVALECHNQHKNWHCYKRGFHHAKCRKAIT